VQGRHGFRRQQRFGIVRVLDTKGRQDLLTRSYMILLKLGKSVSHTEFEQSELGRFKPLRFAGSGILKGPES